MDMLQFFGVAVLLALFAVCATVAIESFERQRDRGEARDDGRLGAEVRGPDERHA